MKASVVTERNELSRWSSRWEKLLEQSAADCIFLTPDWILTWIEQVNPDAQLFFIFVEQDDELVGIAPFYISDLRVFKIFHRKCLRIAGDEQASSEYLDLIVLPELEVQAIDKIANVLRDHSDRWHLLWIPYCAVENRANKRFKRLSRSLHLYSSERTFDYFVVDLTGGEEQYWKNLTSKQRNNIRRYTKQLAVDGDLRLVDLISELGPDEAFNQLVALHEIGWNSRGEQGAFRRHPAFKRFTQAFIEAAREKDWAVITGLMRGTEVISVRFGYCYHGRLLEVQSGYRPELNGSGIVCVDLAIKSAVQNGLEVYDFLAGAGHYKQQLGARPAPGIKLFAGRRTMKNYQIFILGLWPTGRYAHFFPL